MFLAKIIEKMATANAEAGLERRGSIIKTAMDYLRLVR
jgi:hypothetical protein